jgi:hypothetical protein
MKECKVNHSKTKIMVSVTVVISVHPCSVCV